MGHRGRRWSPYALKFVYERYQHGLDQRSRQIHKRGNIHLGQHARGSLNFQNADTLVPQILDLSGQSLALTTGGILSSGNAPRDSKWDAFDRVR